MNYRPYAKVIGIDWLYAMCAIYEPHPFRSCIISESLGRSVDTGIADDEWCWIYYDWIGNPVGTSVGRPYGIEVDKFTIENLGLTWGTPEYAQRLVDYLNMEPNVKEN